jgi:hypothetical protein
LRDPIAEAGGIIGSVEDRDRSLPQGLHPRPAKPSRQDGRQIRARRMRPRSGLLDAERIARKTYKTVPVLGRCHSEPALDIRDAGPKLLLSFPALPLSSSSRLTKIILEESCK